MKEARDDRDEARSDLRKGIDPAEKRRAEKHSATNTFKAVALELLGILRKASLAGTNLPEAADEVVHRTISPQRKRKARRREPISAETIDTMQRRLEAHVFPHVGNIDVGSLSGPDLLSIIKRIEERGTFELAHRVRSICSRVLRYARATGRKCEDVAADLIGLLVPVESEQMAAIIEPVKIGQLLRAMAGYRRAVDAPSAQPGSVYLPTPDRVSDDGMGAHHSRWSYTRVEGSMAPDEDARPSHRAVVSTSSSDSAGSP